MKSWQEGREVLEWPYAVPPPLAPPPPASNVYLDTVNVGAFCRSPDTVFPTVSHRIAGHTEDRFCPVKKAVETVTVQHLIGAILYFRRDIFSGERRGTAYSQVQKTAAFLQKRVLALQQWLLCRAAKHGSSDDCRSLAYKLHAIQHMISSYHPTKLFAVLPQNTTLLQHAYLQVFKRSLLNLSEPECTRMDPEWTCMNLNDPE